MRMSAQVAAQSSLRAGKVIGNSCAKQRIVVNLRVLRRGYTMPCWLRQMFEGSAVGEVS